MLNAKLENFIVKSNALIEARYRLSLQESQIILWLLTQISCEDEDFKSHKLEVSKFAELVQVKVDSRYQELRKITRQLIQRVIEIYEPDTRETIQISWLSSARYQEGKGCVFLKFDPDLKPYLLQLKARFTKIDVVDTLKLKSVYAVRIFELLSQYSSIGSRDISVSDLRAYCGISKTEYADYFDLKRYVINKAKSEINSKTEYEVDYKEIKESRRIILIKWTINKKNHEVQKHLEKINLLQKELRSKQIIIGNLLEYGFGKIIAKRLITVHGEEIVKNAIRAVDLQIQKGKAKNPKAMLQTAIQEKWHPEIFKSKK